MRYIYVIIIVALCMYSCKTRSYTKTAVSSVTEQKNEIKKDSTVAVVTNTEDKSVKTQASVTTTQDSSDTHTTFTPIPGTKTVIHPDGTIEGEFSNIDSHGKKKSSTTKHDTSTKKNDITQNSSANTHLVSESKHEEKAKRDSTYKAGQSDSTLKANVPTWIWIVVLVLILGVIGYVVYRVRSVKKLL